MVIINIGINDLSRDNDELVNLGNRMVDFAKLVTAVELVAEVLICQILPRVRVWPTGRRSKPTRADFNAVRFVVNRVVDGLTKNLHHNNFWRHMGCIPTSSSTSILTILVCGRISGE